MAVSGHFLDNTPSFVFAMSHPYRVQFFGDAYPGRRALSARLALGWYVLRLQHFRRFAARCQARLVLFAG